MISSNKLDQWLDDGLVVEKGLLDADELSYLRSIDLSVEQVRKANSDKLLWLTDVEVRKIATKTPIRSILNSLFGSEGFYLWSARLIDRVPGQIHQWHSDIESCRSEGGFVSLWIAVSNVDDNSTLHAISGSHRLGTPLQAHFALDSPARTDIEAQMILDKVQSISQSNTVRNIQPKIIAANCNQGDGVFFDGRLWHGTFNQGHEIRRALLLQFGRHGTPVRRPKDFKQYPFVFDKKNLPIVLPIAGKPDPLTNHNIFSDGARLGYPLAKLSALPNINDEPKEAWARYPYFKISTAIFDKFSCHASRLQPGCMPHLPHEHQDEEILLVLAGDATILSNDSESGVLRAKKAKPGDFFYYPKNHLHTIFNGSDAPIHYLMFKWKTKASDTRPAAPFNYAAEKYYNSNRRLFTNQRASGLKYLHVHFTQLMSNQAYAKHIDQYDTAIVVLDGRLTVMDKTLGRGGVFFTGAGELHNTCNFDTQPCSYLVFEFHA